MLRGQTSNSGTPNSQYASAKCYTAARTIRIDPYAPFSRPPLVRFAVLSLSSFPRPFIGFGRQLLLGRLSQFLTASDDRA